MFDALAAQSGLPVAAAPSPPPPLPPAAPPGAPSGAGNGSGGAGAAGDGDVYSRVAAKLGSTAEVIAETFRFDGNSVELIVPTSRVAAAKREAQQQITLLTIAVRLAAGLDEEWTSLDHARAICTHYGRMDSNYSRNVGELQTELRMSGGRSKSAKLTRPGCERATEVLHAVAGAES